MTTYSPTEAWAAVALAFLGTFIWRFLGVLLAEHITPDGPLMQWVNAVAYSMVAGVMMLILVFPSGVLGTTQLDHRRLGFMVVGATVPLVLVGVVVNYADWHWLTLVTTLAWANIGFAGLLWTADRFGGQLHGLANLRWSAAMGIGLMQICALIPGASRSGVTMTAARFFGYDRLTAAQAAQRRP